MLVELIWANNFKTTSFSGFSNSCTVGFSRIWTWDGLVWPLPSRQFERMFLARAKSNSSLCIFLRFLNTVFWLGTVSGRCAMYLCIWSAWHGVKFLHSSAYGAVFWICGLLALIIHPPMFELLLNSAVTVSRLSLFPAQTSPDSGLGVDKRLGGVPSGQMKQNGQRVIFCHKHHSPIKTGGRGRSRSSSVGRMRGVDFHGDCFWETDWASVSLWEMMSDFFCVACFFPLFLSPLNHLYWPMSFLIFVVPVLSPVLLGTGRHWSECLAAGWGQLPTVWHI